MFTPMAPMSAATAPAPVDYAAQFAEPAPSPAEQYYTTAQFEGPPVQQQQVDPASVAAALEFQVRYQGYQPTMADIQTLAPQDRDRIARLAQMQAPVYHPGTASRPEATLPTTSSVATEAPANYDEQRAQLDATYQGGQAALQTKALTQQEILQSQILKARDERAQLERRVQAEQSYQSAIQAQQQASFAKAKRMQEAVAARKVDPARVFKSVPAVGIAAMLADAMLALGGAGQRANTMTSIIERDTALQMAEIDKMGADADNALAMVSREFDGDLAQAQAALNVTKAEMAKQEVITQAAEVGLKELPASIQQELAQLDRWKLEQERLLGESAKTRAQQNYQYQAAQAGSAGYWSAPGLDDQAKRAGAIATIDKALPPGQAQEPISQERVTKLGEKRTNIAKSRASTARAMATIEGYEARNQGVFTSVPGTGWLNKLPSQEGRMVQSEINAAVMEYGRAISGADISAEQQAQLRSIVVGNGTLAEIKHGLQMIRDKIDEEERSTEAQYTAQERAVYESRKGEVEEAALANPGGGTPR